MQMQRPIIFWRRAMSIFALGIFTLCLTLMYRMTARQPTFPSWTFIFYFFFCCFILLYGRVTWFSTSLIESLSVRLPRTLLALATLAVIITYYYLRSLASSEGLYVRYAPVMGIMAIAYFFIFEICLFGERFLGVIGRFLKLLSNP